MIFKEGFFLSELIIQNIATFELEKIKFTPNFNCIVGETGSGKSLILDCLHLIFGSRAEKSIIRKDSPFATIEAIFKTDDKKIIDYFNEINYPFTDNEIVIKRVLHRNGQSKASINHQSCNIQTLNNFSKTFIDLVGQFENQKLLSEKYQLKLIDQYAGIEKDVSQFSHQFSEYNDLIKKLESFKNSEQTKHQRLDYLGYQVGELKKLSPSCSEEEQLIQRKEELQNIISEQHSFGQINHILISSEQNNVLSSLKNTRELINGLSISKSAELGEQMMNAINIVEDVSYDISKLIGEIDNKEFSEIIDKLDLYQKMKRKFSTDVEGLDRLLKDFLKEMTSLEETEESTKKLIIKIEQLKSLLLAQAENIHQERKKNALLLEKKVTKKIQDLRMEGASINLELLKSEALTSSGLNNLNFLAETNPGEGYSSVKKSASGGELSRILLAFRQVICSKDSISIFLFDEIDTGVGGETAKKIGLALQEVSSKGQVIAITHLPQIAALANNLVLVDKLVDSKDKRTKTLVQHFRGHEMSSVIKQMATVH